jgi:hypothetical protein
MPRYFVSDKINVVLSAAKFLRMVKDERMKKNILQVRYVPPVLGSDSLGCYKVTLKHEPKQKPKLVSTVR